MACDVCLITVITYSKLKLVHVSYLIVWHFLFGRYFSIFNAPLISEEISIIQLHDTLKLKMFDMKLSTKCLRK